MKRNSQENFTSTYSYLINKTLFSNHRSLTDYDKLHILLGVVVMVVVVGRSVDLFRLSCARCDVDTRREKRIEKGS